MPPLIPNTLTAASLTIRTNASVTRWAQLLQVPAAASFSTTTSRAKFTKARRLFRAWERGEGRLLRRPRPGQTQYLARKKEDDEPGRPFPLNPQFKSASVLDERSRELIWAKVVREGETIKSVSAEYGVDIRRVAAIVRLKEVEKEWIAKGKPLAKQYSKAVLSMLPTRRFQKNNNNAPFEPINELHVHPYTMQQIFWPTSESRHFTREDAAKAFHPTLLSSDKRVPHPELIQMEREVLQGMSVFDASIRFNEAVAESERKASEKQLARAAREEAKTTRVNTERFEFRFKDYNSETVGRRGKSRNAVGWRYGAPYDDRSKGRELRIPTSVP
ncbi:eukaryotic mitochondrial regulator protein-domain-containing protein [Xylaria intraflava]|nr:eukaryotic mitochondrial regulator protein-domain-containing protein [Xylaria intraflava]